ncbi:hypothetical protein B472_16500 [Limnohabitans sp. Rim28]|nr:hypothetical protein B472_16500 [Limnohabitans sp. Rim28]
MFLTMMCSMRSTLELMRIQIRLDVKTVSVKTMSTTDQQFGESTTKDLNTKFRLNRRVDFLKTYSNSCIEKLFLHDHAT